MLRETITNDWFTILFMVSLVLVVTSKVLFPARFKDFLTVVVNSKYLNVYSRDQKFIDTFDGLLYANFALGVTTFIYAFYQNYFSVKDFEIILFLKIAFAVAVIFLIKILVERLIASVFEIDELIDRYLFQKTSYKNYLGLVLLPINALLIYTIGINQKLLLPIIALLILINIFGFLTTFRKNQKLIISHIFYFILYLCAFEIAPYIILYKVFTTR